MVAPADAVSRLGRTSLSKGARHAHTSSSGLHRRPAHPAPRGHARRPGAHGRRRDGRPAARLVDRRRLARTAVRTIFVERGTAPPLGALYLSFTSLAVHDAAREGQRHGTHAAAAAVAQAAHDVLLEYFPLSGPALDAELATSLAMVPDGKKEDAGVAIGAAAADAMIASRADDGRFDPQYVYTKTGGHRGLAGCGRPGRDGASRGSASSTRSSTSRRSPSTGPTRSRAPPTPPTTRRHGWSGRRPGRRGPHEQTAIAEFFAANSIVSYRNALGDLLDAEPMGLLPTTRLFARIDAAVATAFIQTWRLKYEVGFWRPAQAIPVGATDGNDGTNPHPEAVGAAGHQPGLLRLHQRPRSRDLAVRAGGAPHVRRRHPARAEGQRDPAQLRHPHRPRARHPERPHLGWAALP